MFYNVLIDGFVFLITDHVTDYGVFPWSIAYLTHRVSTAMALEAFTFLPKRTENLLLSRRGPCSGGVNGGSSTFKMQTS